MVTVTHFSFSNSDEYNIKIGGFIANYQMWGQKNEGWFQGSQPTPILVTAICIFLAPRNQGLLSNFVNIIKTYRLL